ncbi:polysaccharide deacetylase [Geobacillus stearothermophilus]|uniref:polysaccharide deacetylase family protein n=1 Tax=Geobacillus sp. GHH01 TaxID=1233873 RepID=UPI0002AF21BF|nr:polysaccharide deacetylase [Geobacillus sp. GHH01]AGE21867.1 polysaccharide deacetylase [Geobacillus sp. GHH01]QHN49063.1 polysaccharide deacetylase [Geobacillus stearothermophilus]
MKRIQWPNQKKMAVVLSFDVDAETAFSFDKKNGSRLSLLSMGAYGRRVGLDRVLRLLKEYGLKANFFVPAVVAEIDPTVIERILSHHHPIGCHGYFHERLDTHSPEQEEEILIKGIEVLRKYTGYRPLGYRAPLWEMNPWTPALLKKHGFRFDSSLMGDDIPYTIETGTGDKLLEIPVTWLLDDWEQFAFSAEPPMGFCIEEPDKVFRLWKEEFDALYEEGGCFTLTMHPEIIGRASRIKMLEKLIQHMLKKPGIWFATLNEIEAAWSSGILEVEHVSRIDLSRYF